MKTTRANFCTDDTFNSVRTTLSPGVKYPTFALYNELSNEVLTASRTGRLDISRSLSILSAKMRASLGISIFNSRMLSSLAISFSSQWFS
ncbi:hypothetical protein D3C87_1486190 [compost metagenome]